MQIFFLYFGGIFILILNYKLHPTNGKIILQHDEIEMIHLRFYFFRSDNIHNFTSLKSLYNVTLNSKYILKFVIFNNEINQF